MDEEYKQEGGYDGGPSKSTKIEITDSSPDSNPDTKETVLAIGDDESAPEVPESVEASDFDAEPVEPESPIIEAEIEPETVAFEPVPSEAGSTVGVGVAPHAVGAASSRSVIKDRKRTIIIAAASVALIAVAGVAAWALLGGGDKPVADKTAETVSAVVEAPKVDVTASLVSGVAEYSEDGDTWLPFESVAELEEGNSIRTGQDGRVVLALENGNVLRLDADTAVELVSLAEDKIEILHSTGKLYSRVATTEGKYIVRIEESTYEAIGTAFMTSIDLSVRQLQVYEGEVDASDITVGSVAEGKQYQRMLVGGNGSFAVEDIDINLLAEDEFVKWNISEDQKISSFNSAMGILPLVGQRLEALEAEQEAAEKAAAEQAAKEAAEKEAAEQEAADKEATDTVSYSRGRGSDFFSTLLDNRR